MTSCACAVIPAMKIMAGRIKSLIFIINRKDFGCKGTTFSAHSQENAQKKVSN
jgi:hypothetical protein